MPPAGGRHVPFPHSPRRPGGGGPRCHHLRTAEDLAELSQNCTLDSWSRGKTVYLEADIDLTGADFTPNPHLRRDL